MDSLYSESKNPHHFSEIGKSNNNENYNKNENVNTSYNKKASRSDNERQHENDNNNTKYRFMPPVGIDQCKKLRISTSRNHKRNKSMSSNLEKKKFIVKSEDNMITRFKSEENERKMKSSFRPKLLLKRIKNPSSASQYTFSKKKSIEISLDKEDKDDDTFVPKGQIYFSHVCYC